MESQNVDVARKAITDVIHRILLKIGDIEDLAQNFGQGSKDLIVVAINDYIKLLQELQSMADQVKDMQIPKDFVKQVDDGIHPDNCSQLMFEQFQSQNAESSGKLGAVRNFYDALLQQMKGSFPSDRDAYRELVAPQENSKQTGNQMAT